MTIHTALVTALGELTNPAKNSTANTGTYKFRYADLASILDAIRPVLAKHELALTQNVTVEDTRVEVWTHIHHSSGELVSFGPIAGRSTSDLQGLGSAITYLRRYAIGAALGIAPDEDDDGAAAPKLKSLEKAEAPAKIERVKVSHSDQSIPEDPWTTPVDPETGEAATENRPAIAVVEALLGGQEIPSNPLDGTNGRLRAHVDASGSASPKQIGYAKKLVKERFPEAIDDESARVIAEGILIELEQGDLPSWNDLAKRPASKLIDVLNVGGK